MGWRAEQKAYEQEYYGGYCNKVRSLGLEPIPYYSFTTLLDRTVDYAMNKKLRMEYLIWHTRGVN